MKFPIVHFENKRNFFAAFNGGKLIITDNEYIMKWMFFKVARFSKNETHIIPAPAGILFQGFYFKCGKKIWEVQFWPKTANQLYQLWYNDML